MFAKYLCLGCGLVWWCKRIVVRCPVCRSKAINVKNGVDVKKVIDKLKGDKEDGR